MRKRVTGLAAAAARVGFGDHEDEDVDQGVSESKGSGSTLQGRVTASSWGTMGLRGGGLRG